MIAALAFAAAMMPMGALANCVPQTAHPSSCSFMPIGHPCISTFVAERYYVVLDVCWLEACGGSFWIYEETNGIDGLQRNDEFLGDTTCGHFPADTIVL